MDWSLDRGAVAGGVGAHPALDGDLALGRSGYVVGAGALVVGRHPAAVDEQRRTAGGDQRHHHVDAGGAVAGAVADDHGVVGVVGAGGGHDPPLVPGRRPAGRAPGRPSTGVGGWSSLVRTTALVSLRSSRRPNCHSPSHQAAYPRSTTTRAKITHRRLSRNRNDRTRARLSGDRRRHLDCRGDDIRKLDDRYGRVATDLRVSLTDRCNLRCSYCMPAEGLDWLPDDVGAHRRRGGPAGPDRRRAARRPRGPVHRRRAAGPPWPGRHRAAQPRGRARRRAVADHQRPGAGAHGADARRRRPGPGQRQPRQHPTRDLPRDHPPRPAQGRPRRARGGHATRVSVRSRSTPC